VGDSPEVIGSTGLVLREPLVAETGYVLARDMWGRGFATEALRCIVDLGTNLKLRSIAACVHADNTASIRVLEKVGFVCSSASAHHLLPNLGVVGAVPVLEHIFSIVPADEALLSEVLEAVS
jgi:hypothetical protein